MIDVAARDWLDFVFRALFASAVDVASRGWLDSAFRILLAVLNVLN